MGERGAGAVQGLLASVREPAEGLTASAVGLPLLFVGATTNLAAVYLAHRSIPGSDAALD